VHPSRKLIRAGEKFTFRALVLDADGCATGTRPAWTIAAGPLASRATIDGAGTLSVQADADEGQLEISVSVGGKGVLVRVDVASAAHYDAMLGVSGLNDAGEADQPAVAVVATGTIGGRTASAQDAARERKVAFVAIAGGLAIVLAFVGLIFVRRGAKPIAAVDEAAEGEDAPASEGPPRGPLEQVPPSAPIAVAPAASRPRGKICPTCGERFSPDATFCGRDGTTLVLIN
jgi:hypothetical protein